MGMKRAKNPGTHTCIFPFRFLLTLVLILLDRLEIVVTYFGFPTRQEVFFDSHQTRRILPLTIPGIEHTFPTFQKQSEHPWQSK